MVSYKIENAEEVMWVISNFKATLNWIADETSNPPLQIVRESERVRIIMWTVNICCRFVFVLYSHVQ